MTAVIIAALYVGTETISQNCGLRDAIVRLYCEEFRLTFKMPSSDELKTRKESYHAHHIATFSL